MRLSTGFLSSIIYCFTLVSCVPSKLFVDTSCPGYKSTEFNRGLIKTGGIAIMPVLGGAEKEQYRRPMGDAITESFRLKFDRVISTSEVINILNNENLSDEYTNAIKGYNVSGVIPRELIKKIGQSLEVNYILYTRLLADTERTIISMGLYSTMAQSFDEVYVQCQVWDTQKGDVVWEGKGGFAQTARSNINVIKKTATGLASVIGNAALDGPCEETAELFTSQTKALTNTYLLIGILSFLLTLIVLI